MAASFPPHLTERHQRLLRLGLYAVQACIVAIFVWRTMMTPQLARASAVAWQYVFDAICIGVLVVGLFIRGSVRGLWELTASLWVLPGVWFACLLALPYEGALLLASAVTLCGLIMRIPACQWVMSTIGIVGVAMNIGTSLPSDFLLLALVAWAAYDMFLPPVGKGVVWTVPGTEFALPGRMSEPIVLVADLVFPMSVFVRALTSGALSGGAVAAGMLVACAVAGVLPGMRRSLTVGVIAVGVAVPYTILRFFGVV